MCVIKRIIIYYLCMYKLRFGRAVNRMVPGGYIIGNIETNVIIVPASVQYLVFNFKMKKLMIKVQYIEIQQKLIN